MKMDLNEKLTNELNLDKSKNEYLIEKKNKIGKENNKNSINLNQSNGSIRTTEYSSESGEVISKYISDSYKINNNNQKTNNDIFKNNINKNIIICDTTKKEVNINKNNINNNKSKKAPKFEEYKSEYLNKSNTNIKTPKIPFIYDTNFKLEHYTNQDEIGDQEYLKPLNNNKYNKSEEYKKILKIPHDKLLHICINENFYINKNKNNYNKISVTQRSKYKFLTIIYVSPKK